MFERIKNLVGRLRRKREISAEDFSKIYGAYAEIIRVSWEQMMKQLEEDGREAERKQILKEIEEIRIYGGSVIPKMAEQVLKYKKSLGSNDFLKNNGGRISKSDRHPCGEAKGADCKSI